MNLDPEIRDQAYQFFIEEAPELLETIETGLVNLHADAGSAQLHNIMRAAHSIKGGAASVDLNGIKSLAHRLETIVKALYSDQVVLDTALEHKLLQAYDCLRVPLEEQIEAGYYNEEQALASAEPIFLEIETRLGPALAEADNFIPSSSDLGVDMVSSIFEIDVGQGLEHLRQVIQQPEGHELIGELRAQTEVFEGFAELLNLPGFGEICKAANQAVAVAPDQIFSILQQAIIDLTSAREIVLAGDRSQGGTPSAELIAFATPEARHPDIETIAPDNNEFLTETNLFSTDDSFSEKDYDLSDIFGGEAISSMEIQPPDENKEAPASAEFIQEDYDLTDIFDTDSSSSLASKAQGQATDVFIDDSDNFDLKPFYSGESKDPEPDLTEENQNQISTYKSNNLIDIFSEKKGQEGQENLEIEDIKFSKILETNTSKNQPEDTDKVFPSIDLKLINSKEKNDLSEIFLEDSKGQPESIEDNLIEDDESISHETNLSSVHPEVIIHDNGSTSSTPNLFPDPIIASATPSINTGNALPENINLDDIESALQSLSDCYADLPVAATSSPIEQELNLENNKQDKIVREKSPPVIPRQTPQNRKNAGPNLTARIALERLEKMDKFVGELAINRNSLSLQNEQFQRTVRNLRYRFTSFRKLAKQIQTLSDTILVNPDVLKSHGFPAHASEKNSQKLDAQTASPLFAEAKFDTLELDTYNAVNLLLEELLEEMLQVEESIEDVHLFAVQSNQNLSKQRQSLTQLRDELTWARMVPLSGVLNRFPRILKELSVTYNKTVELKLIGTEVLVDRVVLEKLYDPLLHLLRNAFDHGIELPEERTKQGKTEQGTIEICAYHRGNSTVIEVKDDGQGLDLERIGQKAVAAGILSEVELATVRKQSLYNVIFEPGFSTASQVSDLSGRGVGLDVVKERLQSFNGKITLTSEPGKGTTFVLKIPLTQTLAKLVIVRVGSTLMAIPSDNIEEILTPSANQIKESASQKFLLWHNQLISTQSLESLLVYACPMPEKIENDNIYTAIAGHFHAQKPLLILRRDHEAIALEVNQIITEQELVIKPFGKSISTPSYLNGCTVLGDGRLVPVIDGITLIEYDTKGGNTTVPKRHNDAKKSNNFGHIQPQSANILIIDDSSALRRTLYLTLQKAGYRVIQAKDGREALDHLKKNLDIHLIICDIEMPRMNGFEFLSQRRLNSDYSAIPTIMLTSRSSQKHRRLASQLGADHYFSKPYIEVELISTIKTYLKTSRQSL